MAKITHLTEHGQTADAQPDRPPAWLTEDDQNGTSPSLSKPELIAAADRLLKGEVPEGESALTASLDAGRSVPRFDPRPVRPEEQPCYPANFEGFEAALAHADIHVRYNERRHRIQFGYAGVWRDRDDGSDATLRTFLERAYTKPIVRNGGNPAWQVPRYRFDQYLWTLADRERVDELAEWIRKCADEPPPEAVDLDEWLFDVFDWGETPTALVRHASLALPLGIVQRTFDPGCKLDESLALIGANQGEGKGSLCKHIVPFEDLHTQMEFSQNLKDMVEPMIGSAIVELSEMTGQGKAGMNRIKMFMTTTADKVRLAYRRDAIPIPRRNIFVATVNENSLPNDPSGNRRWVALRVAGTKIEPAEYLTDAKRRSLFRAAFLRYMDGDRANMPREQYRLQREFNEGARIVDEEAEEWVSAALGARADNQGRIALNDVMAYIRGEYPDMRAYSHPKLPAILSESCRRFSREVATDSL